MLWSYILCIIYLHNYNYFSTAGADSLLATEWQRLEDMCRLLQPIAVLTDVLQTDTCSLSSIIPSIMDLECHLQQYPSDQSLTKAMLRDLYTRFECLLEPRSLEFNPIPAAACLLDPQFSLVLSTADMTALQAAAKACILAWNGTQTVTANPPPEPRHIQTLGRFKYLSAKLQQSTQAVDNGQEGLDTLSGQLARYMSDVRGEVSSSLLFWQQQRSLLPLLTPIAEDLLSAPASQAYVERIFSLCGMLSSARRNRMTKSLEIRAMLKLNDSVIKELKEKSVL